MFAAMWRLFSLLLLHRVNTEVCNAPVTDRNASTTGPRLPRTTPVLADIIGLDEAKDVLREAVVLPSTMEPNVARLFWRSSERNAVLLVGPSGLGKAVAAEAAAAAAGALVMQLSATEVAASSFCATSLAAASKQPVVVIIEALHTAPSAALAIQRCLREAAEKDETNARLFIVATMSQEVTTLSATARWPFGYVVHLGLPSEAERKQFLLRLLTQISRIDALWGSAVSEAVVSTLAGLTAKYTFGEIELVVRRAFVRSTNAEGTRDPVALHHFEQIIAGMPPQAANAFGEIHAAAETTSAPVEGEAVKSTTDTTTKKPKESKDPMDGIFGWCNFWLPEALHLPPVVWAMIIFGILAHFMARSTYQPYGHRKRSGRGGGGAGGGRSSLFGDLGGGAGGGAGGMPSFGENMNDWYSGGSPFGNFPPPPGMERPEGAGMLGMPGRPEGATPASSSMPRMPNMPGMPSAGEPLVAGPPGQ